MNSQFDPILEQLKEQYRDQLEQMPLPEGVPEHVAELVSAGKVDDLIFMLKLSWMFGAQAGVAAVQQGTQHVQRVSTAKA